jgi:hypothetical protein
MRKRGMPRRVGGRSRLEEESEKTLIPTVTPP